MESSDGKIKINFISPSIYLVIDEWCCLPFDHHVANPHLIEAFWSMASIGCSLQVHFASMKALLHNMTFMLGFVTKVPIICDANLIEFVFIKMILND